MTRLSPADPVWQQRVRSLAEMLILKIPAARAKIAHAAAVHYQQSSVYRMLDPDGDQPFVEAVARCMVDLAIQARLCDELFWEHLFDPSQAANLARSDASHYEMIRPNERNMKVHHRGSEIPAEDRELKVEVFAGFVPPELLTRTLAKAQIAELLKVHGAHVTAFERGLIHWANRRRKRICNSPGVARRYFILESALISVLEGWNENGRYSWNQVRRFVRDLRRFESKLLDFEIGLVDDQRLQPKDSLLLERRILIRVGASLETVWPMDLGMVAKLKDPASKLSTETVERKHGQLERIRSTLTHEQGSDGFNDRLSELAWKADPTFNGELWAYDLDKSEESK